MAREKVGCLYPGCGMKRAASVHVGYGEQKHEYVEEEKPRFGQQRAPLNPRSEKRETYYRENRAPAVKRAVGDGRQPCGLMHELDGTLRYIQVSPVCTGWVEGIHEVASRGRFGGLEAALKAGPVVDCCHACNRWWSEHAKESEAAGLLMRNTTPVSRSRSPSLLDDDDGPPEPLPQLFQDED